MNVDRTGLLAVLLFAVAIFALSRGEDTSDHLDVVIVGDSFADQSGDQFLALAEDEGITAEVFALGGSALCGWEPQLTDLVEREPEQLVLSFAGNDLQPCVNPEQVPREPPVVAEAYRRDLDDVLELFRGAGTDIYLVAPPPVREPFEDYASAMREMYADYEREHPGVTVIETFDQLGPDRAFHASLPCLEDEPCRADNTVLLREDDGIHLTAEGGRRYARAIMAELTGRS